MDFAETELKKELLPLLRKKPQELEPITCWAERLVGETKNAMESLLPFTESEREFLDRLMDNGEIKPALLTEDEELAKRISIHPGLQWKALNVRKFISKGPS